MKFLLLLVFVGAAVAVDELTTGDGSCSVCQQVDQEGTCCSGNVLCQAMVPDPLSCGETGPVREDKTPAFIEYSNALYDRGTENFCSICCGLESEATRCCSGASSCGCTKSYAPSCY